jgi:hypothetical protein
MYRFNSLILAAAILTAFPCVAEERVNEPTEHMTCNALRNIQRARSQNAPGFDSVAYALADRTISLELGAASSMNNKAQKVLNFKPELLITARHGLQFHEEVGNALAEAVKQVFPVGSTFATRLGIQSVANEVVKELERSGADFLIRHLGWIKKSSAQLLVRELAAQVTPNATPSEIVFRTVSRLGREVWKGLSVQHTRAPSRLAGHRFTCRGAKIPRGMSGALFGLSVLSDVLTTTRASAGTPRDAVIDEPGLLFSTYAARFGTSPSGDPCTHPSAELQSLLTGTDRGARLFRANVDVLGDASLEVIHPYAADLDGTACAGERTARPETFCDAGTASCRDAGPPAPPIANSSGGRRAD